MALIIGLIMLVIPAALMIYMVISIVGTKEGLIIIGISILITVWIVVSGLLISTGLQ